MCGFSCAARFRISSVPSPERSFTATTARNADNPQRERRECTRQFMCFRPLPAKRIGKCSGNQRRQAVEHPQEGKSRGLLSAARSRRKSQRSTLPARLSKINADSISSPEKCLQVMLSRAMKRSLSIVGAGRVGRTLGKASSSPRLGIRSRRHALRQPRHELRAANRSGKTTFAARSGNPSIPA